MGIAPPLRNSRYDDTSHHHHSSLGPRVVFNRDTDISMLFELCTSSNPIALKLMIDNSFLGRWLLNRHSGIDLAA